MKLFRRLQRVQSWVLRTLVSRHLGAGLLDAHQGILVCA